MTSPLLTVVLTCPAVVVWKPAARTALTASAAVCPATSGTVTCVALSSSRTIQIAATAATISTTTTRRRSTATACAAAASVGGGGGQHDGVVRDLVARRSGARAARRRSGCVRSARRRGSAAGRRERRPPPAGRAACRATSATAGSAPAGPGAAARAKRVTRTCPSGVTSAEATTVSVRPCSWRCTARHASSSSTPYRVASGAGIGARRRATSSRGVPSISSVAVYAPPPSISPASSTAIAWGESDCTDGHPPALLEQVGRGRAIACLDEAQRHLARQMAVERHVDAAAVAPAEHADQVVATGDHIARVPGSCGPRHGGHDTGARGRRSLAAVSPGLYGAVVRPLLFRIDPERIHELSLTTLGVAAPLLARVAGPAGRGRPPRADALRRATSPTRSGLAAGFDKRARAAPAWPALGFGFAEVGTVTEHGQPGNPRPRIHRLPADRALINRLGFNNPGARATARRLDGVAAPRPARPRARSGVNLGKSKITEAEAAPGRLRGLARAAVALRRLRHRQRQLAQHPGPARPPGHRAARRDPGRPRRGQRRGWPPPTGCRRGRCW